MRRYGLKIGDGCYIDADWVGEPGVASYASGAIADRGSIVFGHLMTHDGEAFNVHFDSVAVGPGSVVSARAGIFPGTSLKAGEIVKSGEMRMTLA